MRRALAFAGLPRAVRAYLRGRRRERLRHREIAYALSCREMPAPRTKTKPDLQLTFWRALWAWVRTLFQ